MKFSNMTSNDSDGGCWTGCLTIIGVLAALYFIGTAIRQCQCAVIKIWPEEPPYYTTDDDRYHRDHCPYMTEDNYVGDEYDSRKEAEAAGYEPCPNCLE